MKKSPDRELLERLVSEVDSILKKEDSFLNIMDPSEWASLPEANQRNWYVIGTWKDSGEITI